MIGIILLIDSNRLLHNLPQSRQQLTTDKKVESHRRVSSIAYYHKIAGSKPSCLSQAYLIGLKFKELINVTSIQTLTQLLIQLYCHLVSDIDVSDSHNNFSLYTPRKPLQ